MYLTERARHKCNEMSKPKTEMEMNQEQREKTDRRAGRESSIVGVTRLGRVIYDKDVTHERVKS